MGAVDTSVGKGGGICSDIGDFLFQNGSGGTSLKVVYVGYVSMHWEDSGRLPPSGGTQTGGMETKEEAVWDVGLPPTDIGYV